MTETVPDYAGGNRRAPGRPRTRGAHVRSHRSRPVWRKAAVADGNPGPACRPDSTQRDRRAASPPWAAQAAARIGIAARGALAAIRAWRNDGTGLTVPAMDLARTLGRHGRPGKARPRRPPAVRADGLEVAGPEGQLRVPGRARREELLALGEFAGPRPGEPLRMPDAAGGDGYYEGAVAGAVAKRRQRMSYASAAELRRVAAYVAWPNVQIAGSRSGSTSIAGQLSRC